MDHLPLGENANIITVPYIAKATYDDGDFSSYPQRRGYDLWSLRERLDTTRPYALLEALTRGRSLDGLVEFVQSWLFFGLLRSCMEPKPNFSDYVLKRTFGAAIITMKNLGRDLAEWKRSLNSKSDVETGAKSLAVRACTQNAIIAILLLDWSAASAVKRRPNDKSISSLQEQLFLCWSLVTVIANAQSKVLQSSNAASDPQLASTVGRMMSWMELRFRRSGWCPHTIHYLKSYFRADLQMYVYGLGTVRRQRDHSRCSVGQCNANVVQPSKVPRHTDSCRGCKSIGPSIEEIVRILRGGHIPVVSLGDSGHDTKLKLTVEAAEPRVDYVAVSHVWSDGLANPNANELPICQLLKLRKTLLQVGSYQTRGRPVSLPIWFDALCIPVNTRYQALRDFSITKMYSIYNHAAAVLIFDLDLQRLHSTAPPREILARTLFSDWSQRLWTFQEGAGGRHNKFLAGAESVLDLDDVSLRCAAESSGPAEALQYSLTGPLYHQLLERICLNPNSSPKHADEGMQRLLATISHRTTSRANDETVVIASFLRLDVSPLLTQNLPEHRMVELLKLLPRIPPNILFAKGPKLDTAASPPGFAWAPRTLLAPYGVGDLVVQTNEDQTVAGAEMPLVKARSNGLGGRRKDVRAGVRCGYEFKSFPLQPRCYLHLRPEAGLAAFFSGLCILDQIVHYQTYLTLKTSTGALYAVHDPCGSRRQVGSGSPKKTALILSIEHPDSMWRPALMVTLHGEISSDPAHRDRTFLIARSSHLVTVCGIDHTLRSHFSNDGPEESMAGAFVTPRWWLVDPVTVRR